VGADWADQKHCLVTCLPDGSQSQLHWVDQKPQHLDDFFLGLRQKYPNGRIAVVLEQSRGALLYALLKYSFLRLYPVNPRCLADFRDAMTASGAKSDPSDADLLCENGSRKKVRVKDRPQERTSNGHHRRQERSGRTFRASARVGSVAVAIQWGEAFLDFDLGITSEVDKISRAAADSAGLAPETPLAAGETCHSAHQLIELGRIGREKRVDYNVM
jgi:hypothetical protein